MALSDETVKSSEMSSTHSEQVQDNHYGLKKAEETKTDSLM